MYRSTTISLVLLCLLVSAPVTTAAEIRHPAVAGTFYPSDSSDLATMVQSYLDDVSNLPEIKGDLVALIVPHAGLVYSGSIAAYGYKLLEKTEATRLILCGPSHRYPFEGISVYGPGIQWKTPLGTVSCDDELCEQFLEQKGVRLIPQAHTKEHSLEVQLPYIQTVLPQAGIVPLVIGQQDRQGIGKLTSALDNVAFSEPVVLIASTDWQHYRPSSEGEPMDLSGIACLLDLDPNRLAGLLESGQVEMCGGGAAVAVSRAAIARGADRAVLLRYGDSGDYSGDKSSVVGYATLAFYRTREVSSVPMKPRAVRAESDMVDRIEGTLSAVQRKRLLQIARQSISEYLKSGDLPPLKVPAPLDEPGAAFVTLKKKGELRGCIGYTQAILPLYRTVAECAVKAATQYSRFRPVTRDELSDIDIEISMLTPLEQITSLDEIEVGRDGLMIELGSNRGLLLPQVAVENGWDRTTFLEKTCWKAGLPADAYLSPKAKIYRFQALIFSK